MLQLKQRQGVMKDSFGQDVFIHLITFTDDNVFSLTMTLGHHAERWKHFVLICICIAHVIVSGKQLKVCIISCMVSVHKISLVLFRPLDQYLSVSEINKLHTHTYVLTNTQSHIHTHTCCFNSSVITTNSTREVKPVVRYAGTVLRVVDLCLQFLD